MHKLEARSAPLVTVQSTQAKIIRMWSDVVLDKYSTDRKTAIRYVGEKNKKTEIAKNKKY